MRDHASEVLAEDLHVGTPRSFHALTSYGNIPSIITIMRLRAEPTELIPGPDYEALICQASTAFHPARNLPLALQ